MTSVTAFEIMASDDIDINTRMTDKVGTGPGPDFQLGRPEFCARGYGGEMEKRQPQEEAL